MRITIIESNCLLAFIIVIIRLRAMRELALSSPGHLAAADLYNNVI